MHMRHRVIEEERAAFVAGDEVHSEVVHFVGQVFAVEQGHFLAVDGVGVAVVLGIPILTAALNHEVFVKAPIAGRKRNLAPFTHRAGDVTGGFQDIGNHGLAAGLDDLLALLVVAGHAGVKTIATGHDGRTGRAAIGAAESPVETDAGASECVYVGRFEIIRAVSADVRNAKVIGENEDDVGLACGRLGGGKQGGETRENGGAQGDGEFHREN